MIPLLNYEVISISHRAQYDLCSIVLEVVKFMYR